MSSKTKTTATKEEATPTLLPKLRFPEFQNGLEWENKPLSSCLDYQQPTPYLVSGTHYSPAFKTPVLTAGKTFILGYTDEEHGIFSEDLPVIIFDDFTTATQFVDFPFKAKSSAMKILQAKNGTNIKFMFETLQRLPYEVGAHERHWISNFAPMLVPVPKLPEQQKIAEFLSSVDELIAAQARKVGALKTHKKVLMQQLFPREGETQPLLRFSEFQNTGDWEVQRLDEIAHYENGKAHENDISENGRYIVVNSKFISTEGEVRKFSNEGFCVADEGNVLMVLSDVPNGRAIAKCYFVESDDLYTVNQRICRIKPTKVNGRFLFYALDRNSYFLDFDDGIKQTNLRKEDVVGFPFCAPRQPAEQQRIASCLTSLDDLIAAQTQKHEALKTHKKGLMQQLFPSLTSSSSSNANPHLIK
jgi:type I restriction enzyme S subunit